VRGRERGRARRTCARRRIRRRCRTGNRQSRDPPGAHHDRTSPAAGRVVDADRRRFDRGTADPALARSEGLKTINIVRRRAQVPEIAELGGDITLCTEDDDWSSQLVKAGGGRGPSKAIDCVAGRVGAALARTLALAGRLLVYGALSSHRQTEPSAFEMPLFAPRLIYGTAAVQGWFLFHWLDTRPLSECVQAVKTVLDRLASGTLRLPPATRHHPSQIGAALRDAEATARDGKTVA
jgi:NADPH:quinone reductase-like Zn-dependent oxidoreductase